MVGKKDILELSGYPLSSFDAIYVRGVGNYLPALELVLQYAKENKILVFDRGLLHQTLKLVSGTKAYSYHKLINSSLPVLPSSIFSDPAETKISNLGSGPWVIKPAVGSQGSLVRLVYTKKEITEHTQDSSVLWILQKYVNVKSDFRVLVLGNRVLGSIERFVISGDIRSNASLGADSQVVNLPTKAKKLAIKASKVCGWDFSGVDLIQHPSTGEWFVLEVNRCPQFFAFQKQTGIEVVEEVIKYIVQEIKNAK